MASVNPTKFTIGADGRKRAARNAGWKVRYRDTDNRPQSRTFPSRVLADQFAAQVEAAKANGTLTDQAAGRQSFGAYAETWMAAQVWRANTESLNAARLRKYLLPAFGMRPLAAIRAGEVQAFVRRLADTDLAPRTVDHVYRLLASIMLAAVRDRAIAHTPCEGIRLPKAERRQIVPWSVEQVHMVRDHLPERYRALVTFAAGTGLRQGECFGLTVDRIDFLRRTVTVDRQIVLMPGGSLEFGPPKTRASYRSVPVGDVVLDVLAGHLARFGTGADGLVFTNEDGGPISRIRFSEVWRPAAWAAGIPQGEGMHGLRHFYASLLIAKACSVKVVQSRLGHATAAETLNTYAHLWPDDDALTRTAVDDVLAATLRVVGGGSDDAAGLIGG
jgi:integrase